MLRDWRPWWWHKLSPFTREWLTVGKKMLCFSKRLHGDRWHRPPWHLPPSMVTDFSGIEHHWKEKHFTSSSPNWSSKACIFVFTSSASTASVHSRLTMNPAPGKCDLRFKRIFIQKHRCYWEIITKDGSSVFNKCPWWKSLSREGIWSNRLVPFRFISTPPPWFITLSLNPLSLEIKCPAVSVPHLDFLHHRPIIPYVYYKIILLNSRLTLNVLILQHISWCLLSMLQNDNIHTFENGFSVLLRSASSFPVYPASYN